MKKKVMVVLMGLFSLCLVSVQAQDENVAGDKLGVVVAVRGKVHLIKPGKAPARLRTKSKVGLNDMVKTGTRGRVQISFPDGTIVRLGKNSEMTLTSYLYQPKDKKGAMVINVKEGVFRVMGGAITRISPEKFKVKTPTATIGIRGSMFAGTARHDETSATFLGGKGIYVENENGSSDIGDMGLTVRVRMGGSPGAPKDRIILLGFVPAAPKPGLGVNSDLGSGGVSAPLVPVIDPVAGVSLDPGMLVAEAVTVNVPTKTPPVVTTVSTEKSTGFSVGLGDDGKVFSNKEPSNFYLNVDTMSDGSTKSAGFKKLSTGPSGAGGAAALDLGVVISSQEASSVLSLYGKLGPDSGDGTMTYASNVAPEFMSWGGWELALGEPTADRGPLNVRGYWVAGQKTPSSVVQDLMNDARIMRGFYSGTAFARSASGEFSGKFSLTADFNYRSFTGSMKLGPAGTLGMTGAIGANGLTGTISGATNSSVNGAFYGPGATSVGGSFKTSTLVGVFGGSGSVTPGNSGAVVLPSPAAATK